MPTKKTTSPKTTLTGIATLALAVASMFVNPSLSGKFQNVAVLLAGGGLVAAADNKPKTPDA